MNKELQDLVWAILPKEFKEEVKRVFNQYCTEFSIVRSELINLFGIHNLTSDAEGEEMLTCNKGVVEALYLESLKCAPKLERWKGIKWTLDHLFGSKCLPDEEKPQRKYHKGDKVVLLSDDDGVYEVEGKTGKHHYALKGVKQDVHEDMLIPYEEPKPAEPKFKYKEGDKVVRYCDGKVYVVIDYCEDDNINHYIIVDVLGNRYSDSEGNLKLYKGPKYHVGQKVRYLGQNHEIGEIAAYYEDEPGRYSVRFGREYHNILEAMLEPYTEPEEEISKMKPIKSKVSVYLATKEEDKEFRLLLHENGFTWNTGTSLISDSCWSSDFEDDKIHYAHPDKTVTYCGDKTSNTLTFSEFKKQYFGENVNLSQETANCDKEFDTILKDGFRQHNRLHVASMAMAGILANPHLQKTGMDENETAKLSLIMADILIAEAEKGGSDV